MEGIYYSHVVPRGLPILTLMGLVFDKVHFTGAYANYMMSPGQRLPMLRIINIDEIKKRVTGRF